MLLAACAGEEGNRHAAANDSNATTPDDAAPAPGAGHASSQPAAHEPAPPAATQDQKTPAAATAVLREYFRLIEQKKYVEAHRLWSSSAADDDLSDGAFAASFDKYRSYHAAIGKPGGMEGAAGSSYIDFPVTVTGELKSGGPFRLEGPVTLRRVNDVPGATAEQLQWRIMRSALKPRP
jgi:hypothetical protein